VKGRIGFAILIVLLTTLWCVAPFPDGMTHAAVAPPADMEVHRPIPCSPYLSGWEYPYPGYTGWLDVVLVDGHLSLHCWFTYASGHTRWEEKVAVDDAVYVSYDPDGHDTGFLGPIRYHKLETTEFDVDWPEWPAGSMPAHVLDVVEGSGVESDLGMVIYPGPGGAVEVLGVPLPWGYDHLTRRVYCADGSVHRYEYDIPRNTGEGYFLHLTPSDDEVVDPLTDDRLTSMQDLVTPEGLAWEPERLARAGRPVAAAAADGATRLLIRSASDGPATVTLSLSGPGRLSRLDGSEQGVSITVATVAAAGRHYAYCLYWVPDGLPQGWGQSAPFEIQVTKQAGDGSSYTLSHHLTLYQPPVVLLHGLWDTGAVWDSFELNAERGFPWIARPDYPNAAHLGLIAWRVRKAVRDACAAAHAEGVAACRADVIGHSMGGLLARYWGRVSNSRYESQSNYYRGDIRRLVTIHTPHHGTRVADDLYGMASDPVISWVMRRAGHPIDEGAIEDLCVGSPALQRMGPSRVAGHPLIGTVDLDFCGPIASIGPAMSSPLFLYWLLTDQFYDTTRLFSGRCHDLVVACASQAGGVSGDNTSVGVGWEFWHCAAPESQTYADWCWSLLSDPNRAGDFAPFPGIPADQATSNPSPPRPSRSHLGNVEPPPPALTITSPAPGTLVSPGSELLVSVETPTGTALSSSVLLGPGSYAQGSAGDPSQIAFAVPLEAAGEFPIVAIGRLPDGRYSYSLSVYLGVNLDGREPIRLRFWQDTLALETRDQIGAACLAECADGVTRLVVGASQGLSCRSTDDSVATVDTDGNITALAPGACVIAAEWDDLLALLPVSVRQPAPEFPDVSPNSWAFWEIRDVLRAGIVQGYPDGTYQPENEVTRDQMAVYVARALAGGDDSVPTCPAVATFDDVATDHWASKYIEYAVSQNVVQGYLDGTYQPDATVDRGQMAVFVARAMVAPGGDAAVPDPIPPATFPDVPSDFWAYRQVEYCVSQGVVKGYDDGTYRPADRVTRDQMAVYVARAFELPV